MRRDAVKEKAHGKHPFLAGVFCSKPINSSSLGRAGTGGFGKMTVQGPHSLSRLNSTLQCCRQRYVICRPLFFLPFGRQTKSSLGDGAGGNVLPSVGPELGGSRGSLMLCPNLIVIPQQHSTKSSSGIHRSREGAEPGHAELHKVGFIFKEMFPSFLSSFFEKRIFLQVIRSSSFLQALGSV